MRVQLAALAALSAALLYLATLYHARRQQLC